MKKANTIAMLLAGGQGTRLEDLTINNAKPGVMFGGKYRIIDFSLSNCFHSEIYTVGVMTQYKPLLLNRYIGNGNAWALDKMNQGVYILPPYMRENNAEWYKGTADAVYQNIEFIEMFEPEYVLILSGDHIYQMDYSKMIEQAEETNADLVICTREVALEEASRFGIVELNETNRIIDFEEKPNEPKNNLASMGIYVFKWTVLKDVLLTDHSNEHSSNDFGHDIIPKLITDNKRVFAHIFHGYWRDVGTVDSYYKANMDLLKNRDDFNLTSEHLRVYSNNPNREPHFIGEHAMIHNSLIADGCYINGNIVQSIISQDAIIEEDAIIKESILLGNVKVRRGAIIEKAIIADNAVIEENARIGDVQSDNVTLFVREVQS
ncbi:glucose-1-phosphate adenylyltransferase [Gracilibacillus marinus]|jgi:glucose-1-phosphate adenylyltransferase|uniref:Glucose-1-phosphate adenylyltransferase n=1 Tax=Gracilibacillus marinus TaxID=630535 RepID=A0ABV8VTN4_9BACI